MSKLRGCLEVHRSMETASLDLWSNSQWEMRKDKQQTSTSYCGLLSYGVVAKF
jgi:hypothetical protein